MDFGFLVLLPIAAGIYIVRKSLVEALLLSLPLLFVMMFVCYGHFLVQVLIFGDKMLQEDLYQLVATSALFAAIYGVGYVAVRALLRRKK
jgi:hypothetical protein